MEGLVYKSTGSWYCVKNTETGQFFNARIKGKFKVDNISSTNPIAVGDIVEIEIGDDDTAIITEIKDRKNYVIRQSPHNKNQMHIIASNLNQSILVTSIVEPKLSWGFVDRFLVACESFHIQPIIIINKIDLLDDASLFEFNRFKEIYSAIGYKIYPISLKTGEGTDELVNVLKNKTSLISGQSGVGKTSLINFLFPEYDLRTQNVSGWSGKGQHTTTFAEMFDLKGGGTIIDTPGIKEFGVIDIEKEELSHYFIEFKQFLSNCKFNNCLHIAEPECAVKKAVEQGKISIERYESYLMILASFPEKTFTTKRNK